jgi:flagellum-specific peptidoglycan hydrolase FlgJ
MNKRTKVLAISATVILSTAIGYRVYDSSAGSAVVASQNSPETITNEPNPQVKSVARAPDKVRISQSIDSLARQVVANSPNQEEAFTFLVEAKSYRIQELRARRAKERAEEAKAQYDADLWSRKRGQIDVELAREAEKGSVDTQAGSQSFYQGNAPISQKVSQYNDIKKEIILADFALRAIIKEGPDYVARLAYGDRNVPAKEGYTLFGKVDVKIVSSNEVVLVKGSDEVTLYAY